MEPITIACWGYDRTRPLATGEVAVEGCEVTFLDLGPEEMFHRALHFEQFDATELSFSNYLTLTARDSCPYVAIPAFPGRRFRHGGIYINTDTKQAAGARMVVSGNYCCNNGFVGNDVGGAASIRGGIVVNDADNLVLSNNICMDNGQPGPAFTEHGVVAGRAKRLRDRRRGHRRRQWRRVAIGGWASRDSVALALEKHIEVEVGQPTR